MSRSSSQWHDISTAPKDGTEVLFIGRWKPYESLPGGTFCYALAIWTTLMSDGTGYEWRLSGVFGFSVDFDAYNVEWSHWMLLPEPPEEK